ncbi:hypothetical protein ACFLXC_00095 [Chloroflexota bacterium]
MKKIRLWTEDELILLYWFLPIMRELSKITNREFSGIAMKLANLLAIETNYTEGLANASALDREVVNKYSENREELENKVIHIFSKGINIEKRIYEICKNSKDILKTHGIPLNIQVIRDLMIARNPMLIAPNFLIREVLKNTNDVDDLGNDVFQYKN